MYQEISCEIHADHLIKQMPRGIFLTVKSKNKMNTMIIGWGQLGFIWGKHVFIAYVRPNRFTYTLLEEADEFTISMPLNQDMTKEIAICGQNSGRDMDKIKACDFTMIPGRKIETPIIGECNRHYECKVIYKHKLNKNDITDEVKKKYYGDDIYHMVYYGEIVDSYLYSRKA